jgi:hypothetical protein
VDVTAQRVPERAGPYRLLDRIGEGGMGVVHLAAEADGRLVAVKLLRPWVVGGYDGRERLAREVAAMRRVRGPGVAEVLGADTTADVPYVVTRYVPGPSLDSVIRAHGPLRLPALLRLASGLVAALGVVHAAGVVHRDVKPGNVLVVSGDPVLIDFGLARCADDAPLTATGLVLGTPGYLAPESVLGQPAVPATDVHGWAATIVFAATGRSPFGSGPDVAVLDRIRRGEVDLRGVPAELGPLLSEALATEPLARPTLRELQRALAELVAAETARSGPLTPLPGPATGRADSWGSPPTPPAAAPQHAAGSAPRTPPLPGHRNWPVSLRRDPPPPVSEAPPAPLAAAAGPRGTGDPRGTAVAARGPRTRVDPAVPAPAPDPWRLPSGVAAPDPVAGRAWDPPAHRRVRSPFARVALGAAAIALVAVGTRAAPYLTVILLGGGLWLARTRWRLYASLAARRLLHGRRRGDVARTALRAPWLVLGSALRTAAQLAVVLLAGVLGGLAVAQLGNAVPSVALVAGGAVAGWIAWSGPGSLRVRRGTVLLARGGPSERATWVLAGTLLAAAWGVAMWWESYGTHWWPAAGPP